MRRMLAISVTVVLFFSGLPAHPVNAAAFPYNDPHGQWSILLPDSYTRFDNQYHVGDEDHPGFWALASFASGSRNVSVTYRECCRPDPAKLMQLTQQEFDQLHEVNPSATMIADGIRPAMLGGQPALQYEYHLTIDDYHMHWRAMTAFSGGLMYTLRFGESDAGFDAMANDIAAIRDSFQFFGRTLTGGRYSDPQGRFTLTAPPGYALVANPLSVQNDNETSLVTFTTNPATFADDDTAPIMLVRTVAAAYTFDEIFTTYSTAGVRSILKGKGVEIGKEPVRHTTLDAYPAGIMDWYERTDTNVRVHVFQIFTVVRGEQYLIVFNFPEDQEGSSVNPVDAVLASFSFQTPRPDPLPLATWTDPSGHIQFQYPASWRVSIDSDDEDNVLELIGPDEAYFYLDVYNQEPGATVTTQTQDAIAYDATNPKWIYVDSNASPTTVGCEPAMTYTFTYTARNKPNAPTFSGQRWDINHGGIEFLLTGDANAAHQPEINAIISSVVFLR